MLTINCEVCHKPFMIKNHEEGRRFCCSTKCGYKRLTKYKFGEKFNTNIDGATRSENQRRLRQRYRLAVLNKLGDKCVWCGFNDKRALQIDHINGGGSRERCRITNTNEFYKIVTESVDNNEEKYQLLCANCNVIKRIENGEHKNRV